MLDKTIYRGSSPYSNFISANFITMIFQNFPKIFGLCVFRAIYFITAIFWPKIGKNRSNEVNKPKKG